jgi:hypothetical protein
MSLISTMRDLGCGALDSGCYVGFLGLKWRVLSFIRV